MAQATNYNGVHHTAQSSSFGPQRVINLNSIHKQLGCFNLITPEILTMAKDAMLHGLVLPNKLCIHNQVCHQIIHQNLNFVFTQAYDAVVTIYGTKQYFVGSNSNRNKNSSQQFTAVPPKKDDFDAESSEFALIDEIVTDLFENDTAFLSENSNVLLPSLPKNEQEVRHLRQSSFYSTSSLSDTEDQCMDTIDSSPCKGSADTQKYHTIYMKPIIERLKKLTDSETFSEERIIKIVDESLKKGTRRKISKRTFEFKWMNYTMIMSKSLQTILDFTVSPTINDENVITVHPDVVSIIKKSHKFLDYFEIQRIAQRAKLSGCFTTKKKDYRQQFIYEYSGCRIVFASNHSTIVEMKYNAQNPRI